MCDYSLEKRLEAQRKKEREEEFPFRPLQLVTTFDALPLPPIEIPIDIPANLEALMKRLRASQERALERRVASLRETD